MYSTGFSSLCCLPLPEDKQFGDAVDLTGTPAEALAPFASIFLKLRVVIAH
jgi:hypothetical protein